MGWWQKAFAIGPAQSWTPSREEQELVDRFASWVVRRRMTGPALLCLEMSRPLNYVGSQSLHFLKPFLSPFCDTKSCENLAKLLDNRASVEFISRRLEQLETQHRLLAEELQTRESSADIGIGLCEDKNRNDKDVL
ncbi:MAG: hypothetical protein ACKVT0_16045 [Planctomycetaceae bacterium]